MTKVTKPESQGTTLGYDYENRVTSLSTTGGVNDTFSYNGLDTRVGKVDANGSHSFRRDGASVTDPVLNDGTSEYTPGISQTSEAGTTFNASDRMGSNVLQTNSSQSSTSTTQYDAFGNLVSSSGSQAGPFGFDGQYGYQTDSDTNLQLLGHRYYDPTTGRFLTRDPAKDGTNWYDYVNNAPNRAEDGSGQCLVILALGALLLLTLAGCSKDNQENAENSLETGAGYGDPSPYGTVVQGADAGAKGVSTVLKYRKKVADCQKCADDPDSPSCTACDDDNNGNEASVFVGEKANW